MYTIVFFVDWEHIVIAQARAIDADAERRLQAVHGRQYSWPDEESRWVVAGLRHALLTPDEPKDAQAIDTVRDVVILNDNCQEEKYRHKTRVHDSTLIFTGYGS